MEPGSYADTPFGQARRTPGRTGYVAYFPNPIPRRLGLSDANLLGLADAEAALGRLAGAGRLLPDPHLLVQPYLRREAIASTRIEGTQASLQELFDAEASDKPYGADIEEVVNYVLAMETGLARLATLPVSVRLLREMHEVILAGVRGRDRQPGAVRTTQNWIGQLGATIETATFVPPPPGEVGALLTDLERFIHESPRLPPLVQAALVHYQFETIHPFLDGNGRLGRLLIVFFLVLRDRLPEPLLYLSPYFEAHRDEYYAATATGPGSRRLRCVAGVLPHRSEGPGTGCGDPRRTTHRPQRALPSCGARQDAGHGQPSGRARALPARPHVTCRRVST